MTEGVVQIARADLVPGLITQTERIIGELEESSFAFITSSEKTNNPYSLGMQSHKRERQRDFLLFAEYPHVSHVFNSALTGATDTDYGDRGGFNRHVENLVHFLKKEKVFNSVHLTGNPPVLLAARHMSVYSAALRTLLSPDLLKNVVSIDKPLTTNPTMFGVVEDRMAELEKILDGNPELIGKLIPKLTQILGPQRDLQGSRINVSEPGLFDTALKKFSQMDGVFIRYVESYSTADGWYQTSEEINLNNLAEFSARKILERMAVSITSENATLPYCSVHIIHKGKEYQLQLSDEEQAFLKMDAATSRAMRKGGLKRAGISKNEIEILAKNSLKAINQLSGDAKIESLRLKPAPVKV